MYLAPEALAVAADLDEAADIFSFGAVAYHVLTGEPPAATPQELVERSRRGLSLSGVIDGVPDELELLIQYCTSGDRARRPASMTEAAHELASAEAAPAFFDGPQGAQRLPPLAARLATDFSTEARFDNPRAVQLRLPGFDRAALHEVGVCVRDLYADGADAPERVRRLVDDSAIDRLARAVTGELGGRVGVAPRVFLKKLVGDVLDRVDQFADFDPGRDYALTIAANELTDVERAARAAGDPDAIQLDP